MQNTSKTVNLNNRKNTFPTPMLIVLVLAVLIALAYNASSAQSHQDKSNHYRQVNLVSSHR